MDLGESPPPAPRNFAGRDELIENAICLINTDTPIAFIGAGGIGKTAVALTLLDHNCIKEKFGSNRRFIRCEEVQSYGHFFNRLSKVIGATIESVPDMTALRPFLLSTNILLVLDNAETILDPHAPEALALYDAVEELSTIKTVSLVITTRISTVPVTFRQLQVPALSIIPAREVFYNIYANQGRAADIDSVLQQLDHHPLAITLLATIATQNRWNHSRLIREWKRRRLSLLQTHHGRGLPAAIELSLKSPMFTRLGPDAKEILGIIAVLPQGVSEAELEWIFPTVSDVHDIVDTLCILSLSHRQRDFVTTPGPFREYLGPDGYPSNHCPLLASVNDQYITRIRNIAHDIGRGHIPPQEIQWFMSEEANIDFLLAPSMRVNPDSISDVLHACRRAATHISRSHTPPGG